MPSRCVTCGRTPEAHQEGKQPSYCQSYASMDLPEGKTCNDCMHVRFCLQFIGPGIAANTQCDWYPIRFVERKA